MSIITFRCHTTIHLLPLVNREQMRPGADREQQLMERINQGIRKNKDGEHLHPILEWYRRKETDKAFPARKKSILAQADGTLHPVENDNYRIEPVQELKGAWVIYDKKLSSFFVFDPAITFFQKDEKGNRLFMICEEEAFGMIDLIEMNALLIKPLKQFLGVEELLFQPLNGDYYIWTGMMTGIDGLKIRRNAYAGTWLLLQSESQVRKLRMLATIYSMDYPNLAGTDETARRLAKEEAAGQCIRCKRGILLLTEDGLIYMDDENPDNDWELTYPIYNNDHYYEMLAFAYRKQVTGEVDNYCMWKEWIDSEWT